MGDLLMSDWYKIATPPIISDYLEDLHNPYIRNNINKSTQIIVYHGTSSKRLAEILIHGSLDPEISGSDNFKSYKESSKGIFVTTSATGFIGASMYAYHAGSNEETGDGGDEVVLELSIPWYWIEEDPDDTRISEDAQKNDLGKTQGVVRRPINVKRIKNILVYNSILNGIIPNPSDNILENRSTQWMPIGKFLDVVRKNIDSLPEEYGIMVDRSKGLSRKEGYEDREQIVAEKLLGLVHTFFSPGDYSFDQVLAWVFQQKNIYIPKREMIEKFLKDMPAGDESAWDNLLSNGYTFEDIYNQY
jgi:hypothetical protein